jgi:hypothetical protein
LWQNEFALAKRADVAERAVNTAWAWLAKRAVAAERAVVTEWAAVANK